MPNVPTEWTVESLSLLLIRNGRCRRLAKRHGPNLFEEVPPTTTPDRPGAPQHPTTPCLTWRFTKTPDGYGFICDRSIMRLAHVLTYEYATDAKVPNGTRLAHLCEVPACARPDHVRPTTHQANLRESANRVYPDEVLALAVEPGPCPRCGRTGRTPSPWFATTIRRWYWRWTCLPCNAAYQRGENTTGRYKEGQQRRTMAPEHIAIVLRYTTSKVA